ncbi:Pr6Pr family membrane protein [Phaeacidiphilus oryzae]|uniref:Pr6Pr family membrane protein n=1 Tax=Phaeacidiphilus oryzae TaxID=348818 RepID=UPI00126A5CB7|nr:Pr6Pr family membrane protein [Phaeacidiphilus oryzae]
MAATSSASTTGPDPEVRRRRRVTAYRAVLFLVGAVGLVQAVYSGIADPGPADFWIYFTFQSNLILAVCFGILTVQGLRGGAGPGVPPAVKGAATLYILITGLVFNLLLANPASPFYTVQQESHYVWHSVLLHVLCPLMALGDWVFIGPRARLRLRDALHWLGYPLAYLAFALVRGAVVGGGTRYPYPFLDLTEHSGVAVTINCVCLAVFFWLLGTALVGIEAGLTRRWTRLAAQSVNP